MSEMCQDVIAKLVIFPLTKFCVPYVFSILDVLTFWSLSLIPIHSKNEFSQKRKFYAEGSDSRVNNSQGISRIEFQNT